MSVTNAEIAAIFNRIADLLEIQNENPFRVRAYRNAARTVQGLSRSLAEMVQGGEVLEALPTIGKDLAAKIREIVTTGSLRKLKELEGAVSPGLVELLKVPGLGPKRLRLLHDYLDINSIEELEQAARQGLVRNLPGFGVKTEQNLLRELAELQKRTRRHLWAEVEEVAVQILDYLRDLPGVKTQASLRSRERFWDIRVPKIDSIFDNSLVPRPSWSPGVPPQHRKLVAATHRSPI